MLIKVRMTVILIVKILEHFQLPYITAKFPRQLLRHIELWKKFILGNRAVKGNLEGVWNSLAQRIFCTRS
jgi:hypothetical protein